MKQSKIIYGVFNQLEKINDFEMYLHFKGSTLFYLNRVNPKVDIICENSIQQLLDRSLTAGYDYCVILSAGCNLKSFNFDQEIREFISENHFGVAGHPLYFPDRWLELHPQFFIVNLSAWEKVGKPDFGNYPSKPMMMPVIERSQENFHDDYTPIWVRPTGDFAIQDRIGRGWELLKAMFENDWPVITLSENLRFNKFYNYPEVDTDKFKESIKTLTSFENQNWNQNKAITDSLAVKDQIWLFNSETMNITNQGIFDKVANTASGFKIFDVFYKNKLSENYKIIIYDFNNKSINWYKHFYSYENENLLECIRTFSDRDFFTWIGKYKSGFYEDNIFDDLLNQVFEKFGGESNFKNIWKQFKSSDVTFVQIDLYKNPEDFSKLFVESGKKFINLSNIFSTDATNFIYGHICVQAAQQKCLACLYVVDPEIEISIMDFWNRHRILKVKDLL